MSLQASRASSARPVQPRQNLHSHLQHEHTCFALNGIMKARTKRCWLWLSKQLLAIMLCTEPPGGLEGGEGVGATVKGSQWHRTAHCVTG